MKIDDRGYLVLSPSKSDNVRSSQSFALIQFARANGFRYRAHDSQRSNSICLNSNLHTYLIRIDKNCPTVRIS